MARLRTLVWLLGLTAIATACATAGTSPTSSPSSNPTATPVAPSQSAGPQTIVLTEWKVAVPTTIKAGQVTFEIKNGGTVPHELLVFKSDLDPSAYPKDNDGNILEDGPGIKLLSDGENIDPGKSQTRTVDLTAPGKYVFVCNIPGHFKSGMFVVVTVTS